MTSCYGFFLISSDFFFGGAPKLKVFTTFCAAARLPIRIGLRGGDFCLYSSDFFRVGLLAVDTVSRTSLNDTIGLWLYLKG